MNWKIQFRELTGWRPKNEEERTKNDEERWRISTKSLTKTSRKHLGLDFFHGNNFSHKFRENSQYQKGWTSLLYPLSLIYRRKKGGGCRPPRRGEQGCFHQKAPPSVGTLRKAQVGLVSICTPFLLNTSPFCVFLLLSEMLWNFMDYATTPIFFPECCETLRITQQCSFSFQNIVKLYGLCNDACFEGSEGSQQGPRPIASTPKRN